ncbi:MAG: DUF1611 domain-containing protein [Clostridiales bacterium]|nr:DUF1611 domain-containing protein [Clostridiales bacterium]
MGFLSCGSIAALQSLFDKFYQKGSIVVSAFDNNGAVSFPAALCHVIGVDGQELAGSPEGFMYVENSIVNIVGKIRNMRVAWTSPDYIIVRGNSYLCALITLKIAESLQDQKKFQLSQICTSQHHNEKPVKAEVPFSISKAMIFPFNKEMHAIARYEEMLSFEAAKYCSLRITGQVGRTVADILPGCRNKKVIQDINTVAWDEFDTLIIGHTGELDRIIGAGFKKDLFQKSLAFGKNVYSLDPLPDEFKSGAFSSKLFSLGFDEKNLEKRFGKLYKTNKPVLAVIGTNSQQGKFSLQLELRKNFLRRGYIVGQIGTEATSPLFGFDEVFPCGYNGQVSLDLPQTIAAVNGMIWNITQKDVDIIIAGAQSGFIAYNDYNAMMYPIYHQLYFTALQPDAVILCINPFDDVSFVRRTIYAAEGLSCGKVIGIVCFPFDVMSNWQGNFGKKMRISKLREEELKRMYKNDLNKKVYMLDREDDTNKLVLDCINFFC